jgi:hypothetical protein
MVAPIWKLTACPVWQLPYSSTLSATGTSFRSPTVEVDRHGHLARTSDESAGLHGRLQCQLATVVGLGEAQAEEVVLQGRRRLHDARDTAAERVELRSGSHAAANIEAAQAVRWSRSLDPGDVAIDSPWHWLKTSSRHASAL